MMEYQAVISMGKNKLKVMFSDGSVSAMGVTPATFTTENYVVQHAIENSDDYKRGRIYTVRSIALDDDLHIERAAEAVEQVQESQVVEQEQEAESSAEQVSVEFSCNDDAKDYLEQMFGYVRSKLRNREDIVAAGKAHGVDITFV